MKKILSRLKEFTQLSEKQKFQEFQFCLLTPQSNAQRCWQAVLELEKHNNPSLKKITNILSTRTRFHNTKAKRIHTSPQVWSNIVSPKLRVGWWAPTELRNSLANEVSGYGLKEASHFLRNIGLSNNSIAILDRHILRNLHALSLIPEPKIKSQKHYLELEQDYLNYAKKIKVPADVLDLQWWSKENGEIFK